jgi:hypothetical protein
MPRRGIGFRLSHVRPELMLVWAEFFATNLDIGGRLNLGATLYGDRALPILPVADCLGSDAQDFSESMSSY